MVHHVSAESNAQHENRHEEADLVIEVAIKGLKGKDDGQIEDHRREAGCEDGI